MPASGCAFSHASYTGIAVGGGGRDHRAIITDKLVIDAEVKRFAR